MEEKNTNIVQSNQNFEVNSEYICTINLDTEEGIANVANALSAAEPLKDHMGEKLMVAGIVTTPGVRAVSKTPCKNVYLILTDGRALFSQSEGVCKAAEINANLRRGDFKDGVPMTCIEVKINNGNSMKTLVVG